MALKFDKIEILRRTETKNTMIIVLDYGMGNLRSVLNALGVVGAQAQVSASASDIEAATGLVLPGVGAFGEAMERLHALDLVAPLTDAVAAGKPLLGICLGMQLLATTSTEHGEYAGLGIVPGRVERFRFAERETLRLPHVGWNDVEFRDGSGMGAAVSATNAFYFVHSYHFIADDPSMVSGISDYGGHFAATLEAGSVWATQFHPEKSHRAGLALLDAWQKRVILC